MPTVVESLRGEFRRYKALAESAIQQVADDDLSAPSPGGGNSIAVLCWHISGNLRSRFTDFLTSDGEKPWRHRDEEFDDRPVTRGELLAKWEQGWTALLETLDSLHDEDLTATVSIRGQAMLAHQAFHRALAHVASHVGQIVFVAKALRGSDWKTLSIPRGQSETYNRRPGDELPEAHAARLAASPTGPPAPSSGLDDLFASWREAFHRKDAAALLDLCTPDYVLYPASGPAVPRDQLPPQLAAAFAAFDIEASFDREQRIIGDGLAVDVGWDVQTARPRAGGSAQTRRQRVVVVMRRGDDGRWRFARGFVQAPPRME